MNQLINNTMFCSRTLIARFSASFLSVAMAATTISPLAISNVWAEESHQAEPSDAPITSLATLSSLRNIAASGAVAIKTPAIESLSTKTGTPTLFVAAPELPIVDIRLTFDAGSARDSEFRDGLYGLASLTSQLLDEGTSTQSTDDIAANFERLGAEFSATSYRDMFTVSLRTLSDPAYFNPAVDQLLAILKDAQFPQASIDRVLNNAAIGQQQRKESPGAVVGIRFYRELYGKHPYAEPTTGTEASLKKITPQDIRNFKDTYLVAKNLNIAITGQLSRDQAQQLANRISQSLPAGQKAQPLPAPQPLTTAKTVAVPFNSSQSHVMIGQLGITRDNPDIYALTVGNEMLGGDGFNALLMKELREKRGLTYGAYSGFTSMRTTGPFIMSYSTRGDQAVESIRVAKQTLQNFLSQPLDQQLLSETREGLLKSYPLSLSSNESILGYLGMIGFYGLPTSYLADYPKKIEAVTPQEIQAALRKYIQPSSMLTVVVGQPFDSNALNTPIAPATAASQPGEVPVVPTEAISKDIDSKESISTAPAQQPSLKDPQPVSPADATQPTDTASPSISQTGQP
ncbi:M16 family metallopeptidase [Alkanindiges illinoisensis]|uniref:M16 family metallopeptidase n=1 Tax=Alkanindiges illinoisensis TaxID=197183 RepID=UPI000684736C|nr:pitrilysin family protein [Alkanindiges illinoisensis]